MPWSVKRSSDCPADRPWSVVNDESGASEGCHATEDDAKRQQAALYANADEGEARSVDLPEGPEIRSVPFKDLDVAADGGSFEGYAAVFDTDADLGDFTESIQRGAFRKALASGENVPMLYDHNAALPPLATTRGRTLQLEEDAKGLRVKADVAAHFIGEATRELVRRGDIGGMSFGFIAGPGNSQIEARGGKPHRRLTGFARLLDVSPTWDEAYVGTEAAFRSLRALQMAESLEATQQALQGTHQQLEDGASDEQEATDADAGAEEQGEQRSGAARPPRLAAAMRELQVMEATIPREFRR
jgi:HK97 family phage prohead protease